MTIIEAPNTKSVVTTKSIISAEIMVVATMARAPMQTLAIDDNCFVMLAMKSPFRVPLTIKAQNHSDGESNAVVACSGESTEAANIAAQVQLL